MSVITPTALNALLDSVNLSAYKLHGTAAAAYGVGTSAWGAYDKLDDAATALAALADLDVIGDLNRQLLSARDAMVALTLYAPKVGPLISALDRHVLRFGGANFANLETYLKYYNTTHATKWQALQDKKWRDVYNAVKRGSNYPAAYNVFFEALQGTFGDGSDHLYALGLGRFVASGAGAGTFTDATLQGDLVVGIGSDAAIDYTKYAGGTGKLKVSGLAGSGNVTVTGYGMDPATRAVTAAVTWITSITGDGTTTMTKGAGTVPTDSLLLEVSNITIAAGITAGTFYAEAHRPSGRSLLS